MSTNEIIYTQITWEQVPLAHYTSYAGTFRTFLEDLLRQVDIQAQPKLSYKYPPPRRAEGWQWPQRATHKQTRERMGFMWVTQSEK